MSNFLNELQTAYHNIQDYFGINDEERSDAHHQEYRRLQILLEDHRQTIYERQATVEKQVVRWEYAVGGDNLPRGYYSPSLIEDIIISNASRGRLYKTKRPVNPSFTYGFDADGRLILVKQENRTETITYHSNTTLGITATKDHIETVTECEYDNHGRLIRLRFYIADTELTMEDYQYLDNAMIVQRDIYTEGGVMILSQNHYRFNVQNGRLTNYIIEQFDGEDLTSQLLDGRQFQISKQSTINSTPQ